MASDAHKRGDRKHKFCSTPAQPNCKDVSGCADYIDVCKPGWAAFTFARLVNAQDGAFSFNKKYEAHHIVCVAPVTDQLLGKPEIEGAIAQTEWCINNKDNMMAMPLWGHTVKWYCSVTAAGGALAAGVAPPPFANIPQHDIDHNSKEGYTWEVEQEVQALAGDVEEKGHELSGKALQDALTRLSAHFRSQLELRGSTRKGGTHKAWSLAQAPVSDPTWYEPFSMAADGKFTKLGFPVRNFDDKVKRWIERIKKGIAGFGP